MRDFVERLRAASDDASLDCYALCEEAADRVEALETALRVIIAEPDGCVSPSFKALAATALAPEQPQMNQTERLLNAVVDHIAATLEQPSDMRAWEQLLTYCPSAILLERAAKYMPAPPEQDK